MKKLSLLFLIGSTFLLGFGCKSGAEKKEIKQKIIAPSTLAGAKTENAAGICEKVPNLSVSAEVSQTARLSALKQFHKGVRLSREGKFADAIDALIAALVDNPGNLEARYQLAVNLARIKNGGDALGILQQFNDATGCDTCFSFLAKAKKNEAFKIFGSNANFTSLVDAPAERFEKAMVSAKWIGYNRAALQQKKVELIFRGLPAISVDGKRILTASLSRDSDGNVFSATLQTLDGKSGVRLSAKRILFKWEGERILSGKMSPRETMRLLDKRISHIHSELVLGKWLPFKLAAVETAGRLARCEREQRFSVFDHKLTFSEMVVKVTRANATRAIEKDIRNGQPTDNAVCAQRRMIREVYLNEAHQTIMIRLGFCSDDCQSNRMEWEVVPLSGG